MYLRAQTARGGGFWNLRKPRTARYSHIAFNDISCVHCAPGFEIATHRVLPLLSAPSPKCVSLPRVTTFPLLSVTFPIYLPVFPPSRFNTDPHSSSSSSSSVAKQIAKYPQVVDFRERLCVANSISTPRRVKTNTDKAEWSANGVCAEVNSRDFDGSLGWYCADLEAEQPPGEYWPSNFTFRFIILEELKKIYFFLFFRNYLITKGMILKLKEKYES